MNYFKLHAILLTSSLALSGAAVAQQDQHDHSQHQPAPAQHDGHQDHSTAEMDHSGHAQHMAPQVTRGPWSYLDRDNPQPSTRNRWEMIPVPGNAHGFEFAGNVDPAAVCASLDDRRIMVDRATREACAARSTAMPFGGAARATARPVQQQTTPLQPARQPQPQHRHEHHDHGQHDHSAQPAHAWVAPAAAIATANPVRADQASLRRGQSLYQSQCLSCHGAGGRGDGPLATSLAPPPADLIAHAAHHSDGDYAWKIRTGQGPMPGFKDVLTDAQIWDVVNYLRSLSALATVAEREREHDHHRH